jgi:hypothetical protein
MQLRMCRAKPDDIPASGLATKFRGLSILPVMRLWFKCLQEKYLFIA